MSGLQNKIELARKNGYSDAEIVAHLANTDLADKVSKAKEAGYGDTEIVGFLGEMPKRSTVAEVGRQVGLTVRYGVEGITALPNMVGDALGLRSTRAVSQGLTNFGLPSPEGAKERVVGDVTRAMAGQGGTMALGKGLTNAAAPAAQNIGAVLSGNRGSQVLSAAGAGAGSGTARESGAGWMGQTVGGLLGGIAAPMAGNVVLQAGKAAGRGIRALIDPFTTAGREKVVGSTLNRVATDPSRAAENLDAAAEIVPGSSQTTAQAAKDEGLLIAERGLASSNPRAGARLARRASEQNQARNLLLDSMAGSDESLASAKGQRLGKAGALYEKARIEGVDEGMAEALKPQIQNLMQRMPKGVGEKAKELARLSGESFDGAGSVNGLHWLKLAVDDAIEGAAQTGVGKQTKGALVQYKGDLLSVIDEVSPSYAKARETYATLSKPINQMETLQDVRSKVMNAGTDAATGERLMSPAKFYNAVTKNKSELSKVLSKEQMSNLEKIGADLDASALSASSGKAAGSNTTQNISTAYVIGSALGNKANNSGIIQNLSRPISWLNKLNEQQVQDLLVDAMLDPGMAKSLMAKATPRMVESLGYELKQRAIANGLGGLIGASATAGQSRQLAEPMQ